MFPELGPRDYKYGRVFRLDTRFSLQTASLVEFSFVKTFVDHKVCHDDLRLIERGEMLDLFTVKGPLCLILDQAWPIYAYKVVLEPSCLF